MLDRPDVPTFMECLAEVREKKGAGRVKSENKSFDQSQANLENCETTR